MKTFLVILLIIGLGWAGWSYWGKDQVNDIAVVNTETPYPTFTPLGQGGEGPEPEDFVDETPTPTPVRTPVLTPRPTPLRTPTPTPTPAPTPVLVFRDVTEMNGSGEHGKMLISADAQGRAVINFNVVGTPAGVLQPAYIYRGASCSASTEVVFQVNPLMNGSSYTALPVQANDLLFGSDGSLRLVIFQSYAEGSARAACAVIR